MAASRFRSTPAALSLALFLLAASAVAAQDVSLLKGFQPTSDYVVEIDGSRDAAAEIYFQQRLPGYLVLPSKLSTPVLLVPPTDIEIVSIGDRVALTCGPVLVAIDLAERCGSMLEMAGRMAGLAAQPLKLMTVARARISDRDAAMQLSQRAAGLATVVPDACIVRRGSVAEEISTCAIEEGAGLVVMGVRATPKCQPGSIATAVLKTRKAFVLAVPGC